MILNNKNNSFDFELVTLLVCDNDCRVVVPLSFMLNVSKNQ